MVGNGATTRRLRFWTRRSRRFILRSAAFIVLLCLAGLLFWPPGCTATIKNSPVDDPKLDSPRLMRVRLVESAPQVLLSAAEPPVYFTATDPVERILNLPRNVRVPLVFAEGEWQIGSTRLGSGVLTIRPISPGSVTINGRAYRGTYRFIGNGVDQFDVVNDVDIEDYLMGVLAKELYPNWHEQTYRAQAIVARTYALYQKHANQEKSYWDVWADERSQVYGGMTAETARSRAAVLETAGIVVVYGTAGDERIFKTYFSSCCGGVSQSVTDAFGEPLIAPLASRSVGPVCSASTKFNWGPVVISKQELTRRMRAWGAYKGQPIQSIGPVRSIEIAARNLGRPVRFTVTDQSGTRYSLSGEQLRWAVNYQAPEGSTLFSSYIEAIISESDRIRFVGGHGFGHGVGMCQWCAEAWARAGMPHEDIVLSSYPGAKLLRAY